MILGGKKFTTKIPVSGGLVGWREVFSVVLSGTSWVTIKAFTEYVQLQEMLVKIPALSGATGTATLAIFDPDYVVDGEERWNSGAKAESTVQDIGLDRIIPIGALLKIKRNAAGTETVTGVLYGLV
jgi:hypothetical protein